VIRSAILPFAAGALLGCQFDPVDLGSNDAGLPDAGLPDVGPGTTSDCPAVTEAEVQALYGDPCASTCAMTGGAPRVVTSSVELVAVMAGRWQTCAGAVPWPADVVGIEFQAGCTLFLLNDVPDGGLARSVSPGEQGTFNVVTTTAAGGGVTRAVDLFFPTWTWRVDVSTSDCPHRMRWSRPGGGETDFVGVTSTSPPLQ
jgi:hypothetical protein